MVIWPKFIMFENILDFSIDPMMMSCMKIPSESQRAGNHHGKLLFLIFE